MHRLLSSIPLRSAPHRSSFSSAESVVVPAPLAITLPDLTEREKAYIHSQLSYIGTLNPDYLRPCSLEKADFIVRQEYPRFLSGLKRKPSDRLYRHLIKSAVLTQRTAKALKQLGVSQDEVLSNPSLLSYPLLSLPRDAQVKQMLDVPLESVVKQRRHEPLRGFHVRQVMDELVSTLMALDMSDQSSAFDGIRLSPKSKGTITLEELNQRAVLAFVKNSFPEDFGEQATKLLKANTSLVDAAKNISKNCAPVPSVNARMFVRNHWLFHKLVGDDVFSAKIFRSLSLYVCPLETLITLNDLYGCVGQDMSVEEFMRTFARNGMHNLLTPSVKFPPSLRMKLLREVGFDQREAAEILMSKHKTFSEGNLGGTKTKAETLRFSSSSYIPTMQRRLQVLRSDGKNLGIAGAADAFAAMTNWPSVLESVKKIREQNYQGMCLHYVQNAQGIKIAATSEYRSIANHPALEHICNYFKCETEEEMQSVRKDLFVSPNQRAIPISRVLKSLSYLEEQRFSKAQIRKALPLLFYPESLIDQKVKEMREMPDFSSAEWETDVNVLHCCLYFLEKEFHFTNDGLWTGLQLDFSRSLYDELEKELGFVCKDRRLPAPLAASSPQPHLVVKKVQQSSSPKLLQQGGIRQFSTSAQSQDRVGFTARVFYFQNPFKMLKISGAFNKLRTEWDPDLEKNSFLTATKQAVATVTQLIQERNYDDLKGLLSRRERERLKREIETSWSDVQRNNAALQVDEIVLAVPERVMQQSVAYQKFCDIDVVFVAIKADLEQHILPPPIKIFARFHRDYTEGNLPDWVITKFEVENIKS